jgi:hypothetical protein
LVGVLLAAIPATGGEWVVHPTADFNQDGDNIQAAIDAANPGDTIRLAAGTFVLGKYLEVDESWVTVPRGSFRYFQDFSFWDVRDPVYNPWYVEGPDTPPFPQVIMVNKPVTIVGADPPGSTVFTTVNTWLDFPYSDTLFGDANSFLIASDGVTIRNVRFFNMLYGIRVVTAGSVIEDCIFDTPGHYSLLYDMDDYSVYPNFPSSENAVPSYLRGNTWLNAIQAMHMYGSEISATDNYFEVRNSDDSEIPFSLWAIVLGGLPSWAFTTGVYSQTVCRNNLIDNNVVEGDEWSWYGAFTFSGYGVPITETVISNNTVRHMYALVEHHGVPSSGNTISNNEVEAGPLWIEDPWGVVFWPTAVEARSNTFTENRFQGVSYGIVIFAGEGNRLIANDYRQSGLPGWYSGAGCIFLDEGTTGNFVVERHFPTGTNMCNQILDFGDNAIPGWHGVCE